MAESDEHVRTDDPGVGPLGPEASDLLKALTVETGTVNKAAGRVLALLSGHTNSAFSGGELAEIPEEQRVVQARRAAESLVEHVKGTAQIAGLLLARIAHPLLKAEIRVIME